MLKLQGLARDFAARGAHKRVRKNRTKGATFGIQETTADIPRLHGADAIEPRVPKYIQPQPGYVPDRKLFRDVKLDGQAANPSSWLYVELKNWSRVRTKALMNQMESHFYRLEGVIGDASLLTPVEIRLTVQVGLAQQARVRAAASVMLQAQHVLSKAKADAWVAKNIRFTHVPLRY